MIWDAILARMTILQFVATLGAVQGALLLALVALRFRRAQNYPLALLLLVYSLRMGTIPAWNPQTMVAFRWMLPLTTPLPFLFGPLLWWFAHELSNDTGIRTTPRILLHFVPYALDVFFTTAIAVTMSNAAYAAMFASIFAGEPPLHLIIRNAGKVVVNVTYVTLAVRLAFRRRPAAEATPHQRMWLRWLVVTPIVSLALFAFVALVPAASERLARGEATPFVLLSAAMALLIYVFSFLMVLAPEVPSGTSRLPGGVARYRRGASDIDKGEYADIAGKVETMLTAGAYRDPDLSLDSMAKMVGIHPSRLSHAINHEFGRSFPALIGRRRVDAFLEAAQKGELRDRSILDLAFDVGFSSKSTFNRVFKAATGESPTQFRERARSAHDVR